MFNQNDVNGLPIKCQAIVARFYRTDESSQDESSQDESSQDESSQTTAATPVKFDILPAWNKLLIPGHIFDPFCQSINQAIINYNGALTTELKIKALNDMRSAINDVDVRTPPYHLATCFDFNSLKINLFEKIKKAYAENSVNSMAKDGSPQTAHILANMSPEKASKLMEILLNGTNNNSEFSKNLNTLYPNDDKSQEAIAWRKFLDTHSIVFLGGNNSSNFKVTNPINGSVNVLKVDNRLEMPRLVEQHLRNSLEGVFTPIHAERQVIGKIDSNHISRTLLVTDFCPLGSLDEHQESFDDYTKKYLSASIIMGQMAEAFKGIQKANCMFPDAKLTNWLLDSNGRICVADTKSFLFAQNGTYRSNLEGNEYTKMLHTPGFQTSEMIPHTQGKKTTPINAENLHASLLGRNIYVYLTGEWPDKLNYDLPIFKTKLGEKYKQLIEKLTKDPAHERMKLDDAQIILQKLGMSSSPEYQGLMNKCGDLKSFVDNRLVLDMPKHTLTESIKKNEEIIDEFNKLISKSNLSDDQTQNHQELKNSLLEYLKLKVEIAALKVGLKDEKMDDYLKQCDEKILKGGKLENSAAIQAQITRMKEVKAGLESDENREVVKIINKYDEKKTEWFSRNMDVKARKIEQAMANIPIEERAKLLESKAPEVTDLLKALAWHRINPFAKPVKEENKIEVSSSANTFKDFKNKFKDKFVDREDIITEESKDNTNPKLN
jgi:hypothetical protein